MSIMTPTVPFIQQTFDRFDALCFEGVLPPVPIVLTKAKTFLGKMEYRQKRDIFGNVISCSDFRLKISTNFNLSQEEQEDVVIHEMIHYYIAFHRIKDTSVHGDTFKRMMAYINQKYGRHITLKHFSEVAQQRTSSAGGGTDSRKHYICISTFRDGTQGITCCASTKVFELYRLLPRYYDIAAMEWYGSIDPFFNRFPRSNTPKIYRITKDELDEHLKDSVHLRCDGHILEPID